MSGAFSSGKGPKDTCTTCPKPRCIQIAVVDPEKNALPAQPGDYEFTDSAGVAHPVTITSGGFRTVFNVSAGMGTLRYKGLCSSLARACGFKPEERGDETPVAQKTDTGAAQWAKTLKLPPGAQYHRKRYKELCAGIELNVLNERECTMHLVEVPNRADWCVLLAFMDNHSGGFHGSGHAGAFIIDGAANMGRYVDFGSYNEIYADPSVQDIGGVNRTPEEMDKIEVLSSFARVRIGEKEAVGITPDNKLDDALFGKIWWVCNNDYGSRIVSNKLCRRTGLYGPEHQYELVDLEEQGIRKYTPQHFWVNGIVAWAAFRLPIGAYEAMEQYALRCRSVADREAIRYKKYFWFKKAHPYLVRAYESGEIAEEELKSWGAPSVPEKVDDFYDAMNFNCMTFAITVYDQGRHPDRPYPPDFSSKSPAAARIFDHPNAHIKNYMSNADDRGYYDDRKYQGEPEAVSSLPQAPQPGIRHHEKVDLVP